MSATIGTRASRTICRSADVEASSGQETRTMSAPASSQRRIWSIVALTSGVGVLVMVCTVTGAPPPTGTLPTMICRDLRRSISRQGRMDIFTLSDSLRRNIGGLHGEKKARAPCRRARAGLPGAGGAGLRDRGGGPAELHRHPLGQ